VTKFLEDSVALQRAQSGFAFLPLFLTISLVSHCDSAASGEKKSTSHETIDLDDGAESPTRDAEAVEEGVSLKFVSPNASGKIQGQVEVTVNIENPDDATTWSLFYTKTLDDYSKGVAILRDLPAAKTRVFWETSIVDPGIYQLFATVDSAAHETKIVSSKISLEIGGQLPITDKITITLDPLPKKSHLQGETLNIKFSSSHADGLPVRYAIEYSDDAGKTWVALANEFLNGTAYPWVLDFKLKLSARYLIRVTGTDDAGQTGKATSSEFGISDQSVTRTNFIQGILDNNCIGCHSGATPNGNFDATQLTANGGNSGIDAKRANIVSRTRSGAQSPMPPAADGALSQLDRDLLQIWEWNNYID
jgi:hypothetical protein